MRRLLPAVLLISLALPASAPGSLRRDAAQQGRSYVPHQLIVKYRAGTGEAERAAARRAAGASHLRSLRLPRTQVVEAEDTSRALRELRDDPRVAYAERVGIRRRSATPDDDFFLDGQLWGLHNTGSGPFGGLPDADIDAVDAWDVTTGSPGVVVAVVDEGIAYDHPDLAPNMWTNPSPGGSEVDGEHGADILGRDDDPYDSGGHGTHVAGTIAARGNNGMGVTGVAWYAQLMAVRVLDDSGGTDPDIAEGFDYAADNGARIVNASLGGRGFSQTLENAMAAHPGTLFVVAAGNAGDDNDDPALAEYPCASDLPNVVCVAATDSADRLASFSNFGDQTVDLAAPGVSILSAALFDLPLQEHFEGDDLGSFTGTPEWFRAADDFGGFAGIAHPYAGGDHLLTVSDPLSLPAGCTLSYGLDHTLSTGSQLIVERSSEGTGWIGLATHTGSSPGYDYHLEALPSGPSHLRFRLTSVSGSTSGSYAVLDEIAVGCPGFGDNSYVLSDGTSMATPQVSGAAALLLSVNPDATVAQLRNALLVSGDLLPDGVDRAAIGSGRRLNVARALEMADDPIVTIGDLTATTGDATATATTATLNGVVNAGGADTTYRFEYGPQATLGSSSAPLGPVSDNRPVSGTVTGLQPGTTYFFRLVAERGGERAEGELRSFTTLVEDTPADTPPEFGDDVTASCTRRRSGRRLRSVRCRADAALAARVTYRITRRGRTVALGSGQAGKRIRLALRRRVVKRGRYRLILAFTAADGRTKVVRRRVRL